MAIEEWGLLIFEGGDVVFHTEYSPSWGSAFPGDAMILPNMILPLKKWRLQNLWVF